MKKNLKWIIPALALVLLLVVAGGLYNSLKDRVSLDDLVAEPTAAPAAGPTAAPRPAAADFTVYDGQGNPVTLSSFVGKPVVVNFWASWCGPCKSEMPAFQKAWEQYGDQVQFMMVNMTDGTRETVDTAEAFIAKQGYTFPVYFDSDSNAAMTYSVWSVPATYFIDAQGGRVARFSGALSQATLERGLRMIIE